MNRLVFVVLMLLSSLSFADTGDSAPLCPNSSPPYCVVPNWGQIEPGATDDASIATGNRSLAAAPATPKARMAVQMMPTAAATSSMTSNNAHPLKSVVSPQGLFPKETAALLAALQRARFNADGSIKSGEAAIRRAAAVAAERAGTKYTLTLYIKVPQTLGPDRSSTLGKKVDALNAVLGSPRESGQAGTPKT